MPNIEEITKKSMIYYFDTDKYEPNQYMNFLATLELKYHFP